MRAICISTQLTEKQRIDAGVNVAANSNYNMTVRKEYLVLGLSFIKGSEWYGTTILFEVEDDSGLCISTPSVLFKITEPTPSKWWKARQEEDWFRLWPEEMYAKHFHEDLSERTGPMLNKFASMKGRLESE
jgi:hypothetical protein